MALHEMKRELEALEKQLAAQDRERKAFQKRIEDFKQELDRAMERTNDEKGRKRKRAK